MCSQHLIEPAVCFRVKAICCSLNLDTFKVIPRFACLAHYQQTLALISPVCRWQVTSIIAPSAMRANKRRQDHNQR